MLRSSSLFYPKSFLVCLLERLKIPLATRTLNVICAPPITCSCVKPKLGTDLSGKRGIIKASLMLLRIVTWTFRFWNWQQWLPDSEEVPLVAQFCRALGRCPLNLSLEFVLSVLMSSTELLWVPLHWEEGRQQQEKAELFHNSEGFDCSPGYCSCFCSPGTQSRVQKG